MIKRSRAETASDSTQGEDCEFSHQGSCCRLLLTTTTGSAADVNQVGNNVLKGYGSFTQLTASRDTYLEAETAQRKASKGDYLGR